MRLMTGSCGFPWTLVGVTRSWLRVGRLRRSWIEGICDSPSSVAALGRGRAQCRYLAIEGGETVVETALMARP